MALALEEVLRTLVVPLIVADRGELYVGRLDSTSIQLHVRGSFSGCPGNTLAFQRVIEPALRLAAPEAQICISAGEVLPDGVVTWQGRTEADEEVETG